MRCEPWMNKTPRDHFAEMAKDAHWQRDGHRIQRCDATTGHFVRDVALCDSAETAEFIMQAIQAARR